MIPVELFRVRHVGARRRNRLREQPKHGLDELVASARPKAAARAAKRRFDVLEIGIPDRDTVQTHGMVAHGLGFRTFCVSTAATVIRNVNSCCTSWLTALRPIFAGLK